MPRFCYKVSVKYHRYHRFNPIRKFLRDPIMQFSESAVIPKINMLEYPFVGVGAVVWKQNKFMLIRRAKHPRRGEWSIPGGRQELGETAKEAAYREVLEETSVQIDILGLVDVVDSIIKDEEGNIQFHATLIDYVANYVSGTPQAGDDAAALDWFILEDLPKLNLWKETNRVIYKSAAFKGLA